MRSLTLAACAGPRARLRRTRLAVVLVLLLALAPLQALAQDETAGAAADESAQVVEDDPLFEDDPLYGDEADEEDFDPLFDDEFDLGLEEEPTGFPDPWEKLNRGTLYVNRVIDRFLMDPITVGYRWILPEQVRRTIERVLDNVNSTQTICNDVFQLEWTDAGITTARLIVNSSVGIAGIFDPAKHWGLPAHVSDFGQTLAIAGSPSGPYVMIPLLGPSNVRDGIGIGVDAFLHPTFFILSGTDVLFFSGSAGLTERARHFEELKALEESSIDYYAALRSGYYQNRQAEIWDRREARRPQPEVE